MRARVKSLGVLVSALLVTCSLSWPEEAKKGPDKAAVTNPEINGTDLLFPPGFDRLYDKIYYDTKGTTSKLPQATAGAATGEPKKKSSPLSLRLYGGFSRLAAGDVNEGCDGYFELLELYAPLIDGTTSGGYSPVHAGYNFGADFIFQLSPSIGVGIGAGYLQSSKSSLMTLSATEGEITLTGTPKLSAMPIRLAVFLTVPLGGKFNLTADAGAAYYAGLKFEAVGRYARFKNFDTATGTSQSSGGDPVTDVGKIYLATTTELGMGTWSMFIISDAVPLPDPDVTYREPKIDLSGFSLQAGIRIRL